ncbi:MAG: hypothetical protein FJ265_02875 [Planctomycetes bacterium]|nr:hypothetical protein [Planctomycetota bacterium]
MPMAGEGGFLSEDRALYPLTFLVLRGLLGAGWIGTDEFWLRLPFAVAGILSVPVLGICGRRLVGPGTAVLAAWFCAVDPWHVYWSQNARGYVLVFLCTAVAANRAASWSRTGRSRDLLGALGATAVGFLCHPTAALLCAGLLAFVAVRNLPVLRGRTVALLLAAGLALIWGLPEAVAYWTPYQDFLRSKADPSLLHFAQTAAYYYRPVLLLCAAGGLWLFRTRADRRPFLLLSCLLIVPFAVLSVIGGQLVKTTARYSICAFPVLLWFAAYACRQLGALLQATGRRGLPRAAGLLLPALVFADFGGYLQRYYTDQQGDRAAWRQACEFALRRVREPGHGLWILTVNEPTVWYYVDPGYWAPGPGGADPDLQVHLLRFRLDGRHRGPAGEVVQVLHEPGGRNHLLWWAARARAAGVSFAVLVTRPELDEIDDGQLWPTLQREFDLRLHLPCFVGPKDESIYVFVPRAQ